MGIAEVAACFMDVVGSTAQREIVDGRVSAAGVGDEVVDLELVRRVAATAVGGVVGAAPLVAREDGVADRRGDVAAALALARLGGLAGAAAALVGRGQRGADALVQNGDEV